MKVTIHTAKTTLSRLIERAHAGEEIVIARGDVPVARLVPIAVRAPRRKPGTLRKIVRIPDSVFRSSSRRGGRRVGWKEVLKLLLDTSALLKI